MFQTNGFVVSQRLERRSFADVYYDLYTDDLPVFVTADSVLQAWHRSIVTMLAEIEETCFQQTLSNLVVSMSAQVPALWAQAAGTADDQWRSGRRLFPRRGPVARQRRE